MFLLRPDFKCLYSLSYGSTKPMLGGYILDKNFLQRWDGVHLKFNLPVVESTNYSLNWLVNDSEFQSTYSTSYFKRTLISFLFLKVLNFVSLSLYYPFGSL